MAWLDIRSSSISDSARQPSVRLRITGRSTIKLASTGFSRLVLGIYILLGLVSLTAFTAVGFAVRHFFAIPSQPEIAHHVGAVCVLLGIRGLLAFVASAFSGILAGHDRFDLVNAINLTAAVVRLLIVPLALQSTSALLGLAMATALLGCLETGAMIWIAHKANPLLAVRWAKPTAPELRLLYGFGLQSFLIVNSLRLTSYTDSTVIGILLCPASVALFALPQQLLDYGRSAVTTFAALLLPGLVAMQTAGDTVRLREAFLSNMRVGGAIGALVLSILIGLGDRFLGVWIGPAVRRVCKRSASHALPSEVSVSSSPIRSPWPTIRPCMRSAGHL